MLGVARNVRGGSETRGDIKRRKMRNMKTATSPNPKAHKTQIFNYSQVVTFL
jgi:hypothetical protein